ncbi:hypothetical protein NUW58_g3570 [Xylaria curta]|uniref:Uncharacterized protein n=2 Tax=Xylaria curta TaxID=42375 RepID=A0ACC1P307_9PEZI|nr:hypothetical protein NUW58_g5666 [Xylaria curta]KAJ2989244.1 hypothetical protein NUW58_g3570 [Xylaria curta]
MAEQQAPLKAYRGNCHCAAFVYEITLPEIKQAAECNCSICYKKAAIWVFPKPSDVKFVKGDPSALTDYNFNKRQYTHKFCPTCGVSLMVVGHRTPPKAGEEKLPDNGFNLRTFQHGQVDAWKLETKSFDGYALDPAYEVPKFTGSHPIAEVEGGQYGAMWTYQPNAQFVIEGRENTKGYSFGKKIAEKLFCKICGVLLFSEPAQLTDEQVAELDENARKWYDGAKVAKALNLRTINGLNVKDLSSTRFDGYNFIKPGYVEP